MTRLTITLVACLTLCGCLEARTPGGSGARGTDALPPATLPTRPPAPPRSSNVVNQHSLPQASGLAIYAPSPSTASIIQLPLDADGATHPACVLKAEERHRFLSGHPKVLLAFGGARDRACLYGSEALADDSSSPTADACEKKARAAACADVISNADAVALHSTNDSQPWRALLYARPPSREHHVSLLQRQESRLIAHSHDVGGPVIEVMARSDESWLVHTEAGFVVISDSPSDAGGVAGDAGVSEPLFDFINFDASAQLTLFQGQPEDCTIAFSATDHRVAIVAAGQVRPTFEPIEIPEQEGSDSDEDGGSNPTPAIRSIGPSRSGLWILAGDAIHELTFADTSGAGSVGCAKTSRSFVYREDALGTMRSVLDCGGAAIVWNESELRSYHQGTPRPAVIRFDDPIERVECKAGRWLVVTKEPPGFAVFDPKLVPLLEVDEALDTMADLRGALFLASHSPARNELRRLKLTDAGLDVRRDALGDMALVVDVVDENLSFVALASPTGWIKIYDGELRVADTAKDFDLAGIIRKVEAAP